MPADQPLTRRQLLVAGTAAASAALLARRLRPFVQPAGAEPAAPAIRVRDEWAAGLAPTGPLEPEPDVRFLLVHHSASTNTYGPEAVAGEIRSFYRLHTAKGWHDVAYNFFVDRFGGIWEARQGSLAGPVKGDATGGSQGHALLCCFVGDHRTSAPTPEAQAAMTDVLAFLAQRHGIDPRAKVSFVSRGSNRWPAGAEVTTDTIAAHREMSRTACPGDAAYAVVKGPLPQQVAERMGMTTGTSATTTPSTAPPTTTTTGPPPTTTTTAPAPTTTTTAPAATTTSRQMAQAAPAQRTGDGSGDDRWVVLGGAGAALATALVWGRRRSG